MGFTQDYNPGYELGKKTYFSLRSSVLKETRTAEIIVPDDFTTDPEHNCQTIYILDGIRAYHYVAYDYLRGGGAMHEMGTDRFEATLRAQAPADLAWACRPYSNETHLTTWLKGFWDGVKFCYGGYYANGISFKPMNGIVLKDTPFDVFCYQRKALSYIRYTLDGSAPSLESQRFLPENQFKLSKDTTLTIKSFWVRKQYNATANGRFTIGRAFPGLERSEEGVTSGGLRFAPYQGDWNAPPTFSTED